MLDDWQKEFDDIRRRYPVPAGGLIRDHLVVLPKQLRFLNRSFGAAFVWLFWIFVDPNVIAADADIRHYLLLHEWGHVRRRHNQVSIIAMTLTFVVFGLLQLVPILEPQQVRATAAAIGLCALIVQAAAVTWVISEAREFEADEFAASVLGPAETIAALGRMVARSGNGWTPLRLHRRAALYRLIERQRSGQ